MKNPPPHGSGQCPVSFALNVFGDKWSLLILRDMFFKQKRHYGEFLRSAEKISTNILANRLHKLESAGLTAKTRDADNALKFIYRPTDKGRDLLPLLLEMIAWSCKYDPQPGVPDNIIDGAPEHLLQRSREDRQALITDILNRLDRP